MGIQYRGLTLSLLMILPCIGAALPQQLDSIAATVNDSIITEKEVSDESRYAASYLPSTLSKDALRKKVLDKLILESLQVQYANATGIQIDELALDDTISTIAADNNKSVSELREALKIEGIDFENYREGIRKQMTINYLQQRDLESRITVSDNEVNQFLHSVEGLDALGTEYQLSHLLVPLSSLPTPDEVDKIEKLAYRLFELLNKSKSLNFNELIKQQEFIDKDIRISQLGWRKIPELPTLFTDAVPFMKPGTFQGPFRSASGFHIIKLIDKRQAKAEGAESAEMHVRHILLKPGPNASESTVVNKLTQMREDIIKNNNFETLAKTHSEDLASKNQGGDLNWITQDAVVPEFNQALSQLKNGEISQPFQTPFGWHIAQLLDRKEIDSQSLFRKKARHLIRKRKIEEKRESWLRQLREEAYIQIHQKGA